jgi:hypothetical protein
MYLFNRMCFIAWRNYGILKVVDDGDTPATEEEEEDLEDLNSRSGDQSVLSS